MRLARSMAVSVLTCCCVVAYGHPIDLSGDLVQAGSSRLVSQQDLPRSVPQSKFLSDSLRAESAAPAPLRTVATPEPIGIALLGFGLAGLLRRRKKRERS